MGDLKPYVDQVKDLEDKDSNTCQKFQSKQLTDFKAALKKGSQNDKADLRLLLLSCIRNGTKPMLEFAMVTMAAKHIFKWKENGDLMTEILETVTLCGKDADLKEDKDYYNFMEKVVEIMRGNQLLQKSSDGLHSMLIQAFEKPNNQLLKVCNTFTNHIPWVKMTNLAVDFFNKSFQAMKENPRRASDDMLSMFILGTSINIYRNCMNNVKQAKKYQNPVSDMFNWAVKQEWFDAGEKTTLVYEWLKETLETHYHAHMQSFEMIEPIFQACFDLWQCDDECLRGNAQSLFTMVPGKLLMTLNDDAIHALIETALTQNSPFIANFQAMYDSNPEKMNPHLDFIVERVQEGEDTWTLSMLIQLFTQICLHHPEGMTAKCVQHLVESLTDSSMPGAALHGLVPLAEKWPELFDSHDDAIIDFMYKEHDWAANASKLLVHITGKSVERAARYLLVMKELAGVRCKSVVLIHLINNMKEIGIDHPQELAKYKDFFEEKSKDITLKPFAEAALDAIAGRSLEAVSSNIHEAKEDVIELDTRATNTEEKVSDLVEQDSNTKGELGMLSHKVNDQGSQLKELEDVVEETVERVEEIDQKTLSHAPVWSKDVSKLLNLPNEHDWRLLASKLGYSNDDIRSWSTQPDPCLSLFDEWFATNKTREASQTILKHLEEMDRMDAYIIVENTLKHADGVVVDEEADYATPRPLFISYQWSLQEEVKLLKNHLEMAGFEGFMDIGQMGGGDKLFEKIDSGIRAAKVVICCVSEKYAKSPNCNREVNLSVNLGKPIIPLLMEKMSWPPKGSMGPIFGEYLFIRFFSRSGEESGDNRYWALAKFQELLMQIRYNIAPKEELITELYADWMSPPAEIVTIKPKEITQNENPPSKALPNLPEEQSPDIFISYQWDKQPQVKSLYNKLASSGYTCWLDILQMGGGDSLYDKIDKGIRGCKVVISCVTSKYALSANCRREVSLADSLKKPVIPLLLEKMSWPPEGPIGMVFTQLLYINFHAPDESIQNSWDCPQFKELEGQINNHVPRILNDDRMTKKSDLVPRSSHDTSTDTKATSVTSDAELSTKTEQCNQKQKSESVSDNDPAQAKTAKSEENPPSPDKERETNMNDENVTDSNHINDVDNSITNSQRSSNKSPKPNTPREDSPKPKKSSTCDIL